MIGRALAAVVLLWLFGFLVFALRLPGPASAAIATDGIVVPTGGPGRIARGLALLEAGKARHMLVSGVGRQVTVGELARAQQLPERLVACCVDLGREAVDTRSNGLETARWVAQREVRSVRLVTTDWHMPRARFELEQALGSKVTLVPDAIESAPSLSVLLREYNKYLLRRGVVLVGL